MRRFAIRFGDNDFYNTMMAFGRAMLDSANHSAKNVQHFGKPEVTTLWNTVAPGLYLMFQNRFTYGSAEDREHVFKYLQITEDKVLLDEEASEYALSGEFLNSEVLYVDLENNQMEIY